MTGFEVPPHQVPGWVPGMRAAMSVHPTGVLTHNEWEQIARYVTAALTDAIPHVRAETLADLADDLATHFPDVADILDHASYEIREALTR